MDLDEHKQFKGSANIKFRRPGSRFSMELRGRERLARRDAHGRTGVLRPEAQRAAAAAQRAELEVRGPRGEHHSGPEPPLADDAAHRGEQERPDAAGHDEPGEQSRTDRCEDEWKRG